MTNTNQLSFGIDPTPKGVAKIDTNKLARQIEGLEKWKKSGKIGTLWYPTGFGKTFTVITYLQRLCVDEPNIQHEIEIIVPSVVLEDQWKEVLEARLINEIRNNFIKYSVKTIQYHQYHDTKISNKRLLIVDEVHECFSSARQTILKLSTPDEVLCLTATWKDRYARESGLARFAPVVDKITEREALENRWISRYVEYNVPVEITDEEQMLYDRLSEKLTRALSMFYIDGSNMSAFELANACLRGGKDKLGRAFSAQSFQHACAEKKGWKASLNRSNPEHREIINKYSPNMFAGYARNLMDAVRDRKNVIYNSLNKMRLTQEILKRFQLIQGELPKTVVFSQTISFADDMAEMINNEFDKPDLAVSYHSKMKSRLLPMGKDGKMVWCGAKRLKKYVINRIKSGKSKIITAAMALDRGLDVQDLKLCITASGTQSPTQRTQRDGRSKRVDPFDPNAVVIIINLYVANTVDEKWLKKRQTNQHESDIVRAMWVDTLDDIPQLRLYDRDEDIDLAIDIEDEQIEDL